MESLKNNKFYNLFTGILLIGFGGFRLFKHYNDNPTLNSFRLAIAFASIGYGIYALYNYMQLIKKDH